jgi:hypothetical protein
LTPFHGRFGWNPRGDKKYDLIWFYESFHHCTDFRAAVRALKRDLSPTGRVLLAGEPIRKHRDDYLPYPWGLRLDCDTVAAVRIWHWFELGFTEDFLVSLFANAGFVAERMECAASAWGEGYIFRHRPDSIAMRKHWLPADESETWHGQEPDGRWTREESYLTVDATDSFTALEIEAANCHAVQQSLELTYGRTITREDFQPGERRTLRIDAQAKAGRLVFRSKALIPAEDSASGSTDTRALGIFVHQVRYK